MIRRQYNKKKKETKEIWISASRKAKITGKYAWHEKMLLMQIKTTMRYYNIPFVMASIKKWLTISSVSNDEEELELSYIALGTVKRYNHFGKQIDIFLKKLTIHLAQYYCNIAT